MYIVYRCYDNTHGNLLYNKNCVIGIYNNYTNAYNDLLIKLHKLNYTYELDNNYDNYDNYTCLKITHKNNMEIKNTLNFEIAKKNIKINNIVLR